MHGTVLLLVDLQKDFFDPRLRGVGRLEKALGLPATRVLLNHARKSKWPIFHVLSIHTGSESLPRHLRRTGVPPYCLAGTPGSKVVDGLVREGETVLKKQGYSAFDGTNLAERLSVTESVVLAGLSADCCVLDTALQAHALNKDVYLPYQAIAASGVDEYVSSLATLAKSAAFIADLRFLLRSEEPTPEHSVPLPDIKSILHSWFTARLEILNRLKEQRPELLEMEVDDALRLLEETLGGFSDV